MGAKLKGYVYQSFKFQLNYDVALVVRPILSDELLISKGAQVVFGVRVNSSYIQLLDGHKNPMLRENGATVLKATLVDRSDTRNCDLVALVVSIEMPSAVEPRRKDEENNPLICFMFRFAERAHLLTHIMR